MYDIKLVFVQKITFVPVGKSTKTAATRAAPFDSNMHQVVVVGWGFGAPDTTRGAYSAPPDPLTVFIGPNSKGRGEKGKGEKKRKGREERKGRGRRGREFVLCRKKKKEKSGRLWLEM